ncbi:MAG: hypothetical protein FWH40_10050 [Coriobacteriia bacterium]|nr:hypothetical protein [Coriobacteriia bacterium]
MIRQWVYSKTCLHLIVVDWGIRTKAIKSLLLIGFCMMSAGTVMGTVAFQVIGLVGCIVLLGFNFVIRRKNAPARPWRSKQPAKLSAKTC